MATGKMSNIENTLAQLEDITSKLESGSLSIDEAIDAYSKGMELALVCKKSLEDLKQKVIVNQEKIEQRVNNFQENLDSSILEDNKEDKTENLSDNLSFSKVNNVAVDTTLQGDIFVPKRATKASKKVEVATSAPIDYDDIPY